jgi:lysophospholipid acyltransferase 1/2
LAEAVNNAGGLGFNGIDEKGRPKWDLLTNIKPWQLETATSLKVILDYWNMRKSIYTSNFLCIFLLLNIETALWLRRICYDRMTKGRTLGVFVLSAIWVRKRNSFLEFEY